MPGVQSVGLAFLRILGNNEWDNSMTVAGYTPAQAGSHPEPYKNLISPAYFATMGIPIMAGRDFTTADTQLVPTGRAADDIESAHIIVNETFVRKYFAGRNPIGGHVGFGSDPGTLAPMEIIGVVKDTKYTGLRDEIPEQAFIPYRANRFLGHITVYVRTTIDPNQFFAAVRGKVRDLDSNIPVFAMRTTEEQIRNSLSTERLIAGLSSVVPAASTRSGRYGTNELLLRNLVKRARLVAGDPRNQRVSEPRPQEAVDVWRLKKSPLEL